MSEPSRSIRAFIALKTPSDWEEPLREFQTSLRQHLPSRAFRWVEPRQMHVTLRFFGNLRSEQVPSVSERLIAICAESDPFEFRLEGLGCFPSERRPRVIWAGLRGGEASLENLVARINDATGGFGERPDERPFVPHLTLARAKEPSRAEVRILAELLSRPVPREVWTVDEVLFLESTLSASGAHYEVLSSHPLRAG